MSQENLRENKIEIPKWNEVRLFRVRHGISAYKEHEKILQEGEHDLTERGIQQIERSADRIANVLDPAADIIAIISSTRKRSVDSAAIIRERLMQKGFDVWRDPKERYERQDIRSADLKTTNGSSVSIHDSRYLDAMREVSEAAASLEGSHLQAWAQGTRPSAERYHKEPYESVSERSRNHLALLMRVARRIQPAIDKHLVVIEVEHSESIAGFLDIASDGALSLRKSGYEIPNGDFIELTLPVDGNIIRSTLHAGDASTELRPIAFDRKRREFKHINE